MNDAQSASGASRPSRLPQLFTDLRAAGHKALMPFITAGFPSLDVTERVIPKLEEAGASAVEIGFPYSDPIADGPVIAASMHHALLGGVTPRHVFEMVARVRSRTRMALVAMVSDSIIARTGEDRFVGDAANAGFDGLIVPDIDLDAAEHLRHVANGRGLCLALLIAPTTSPRRIARIASLCSGFVYVLARVGITGEAHQLDLHGLGERIRLIRQHTDLPIAVGFGISTPDHVRAALRCADAAIIGSALVRRMAEQTDPCGAAFDFLRSLQPAAEADRDKPER